MEEETCSRRGSEGGGGAFKKLLLPRGVQFSQVIIFGGGGKFMIDHTFLKCERK